MFSPNGPPFMTNPVSTVGPGGSGSAASPLRSVPESRAARQRPFSLTRWFSLLSFVCIVAACVILSSFLSRFLTAALLERDAHVMAEVV